MKQAFTLSLLILVFSGCTKNSNGVGGTPPIDPTQAYTIKFDVNDQVVKTRVGNDTLYLDYDERVNFLVEPSEYAHSWALQLQEDFTKSYLNGLNFSALSEANIYATNWVSQNLNNVHPSQKSVVDTTVNGKKYTKIRIARTFKFVSVLANQQAATDKQNTLVVSNSDSVKYASFYYYDGIFSLPNTKTSRILYTK